jgi:hypothetical protein
MDLFKLTTAREPRMSVIDTASRAVVYIISRDCSIVYAITPPKAIQHFHQPNPSQQFQTTRNLIHDTLRCRSNTQYRRAPRSDLRPPCIVYDLSYDAQTHGLSMQQLQLLLALHLQGDLGLALSLPATKYGGASLEECLVAGERCV